MALRKDTLTDAIMLAFLIYAGYMEGIKGIFKSIGLVFGTIILLESNNVCQQ